MNRYQSRLFLGACISFGLLAAVRTQAASVTLVNDATWGGNSGVPSYVDMYIYVPDNRAAKPPILVAHHSCGTPVSGYVNSITGIRSAADRNGFILILPQATGRNCWDVGSPASLTHDGGGDTQAIVKMVKYALTTYNGDASRVYAMGGSSGAMMTQALMAVYPDVFRAGSARAGVAAGCWADGYASSNQWSNNCAGGNTNKTAQQWGDLARSMDAGYTGHRPRIQLFHGTADTTINYRNMAESIEEWTNVLGLSAMPALTDSTTTPVSTYARQFWKNACGFTVFETWAGQNGTHSMAYEENAILKFFGLDTAGGTDPEPACPSGGGAGGMGGMSGSTGTGGAGGSGPSGGQNNGGAGPLAGSGGITSSGGTGGSAGSIGAAGMTANGGGIGTGGTQTTGGSPGGGVGGSSASGSTGAAGTIGSSGSPATGGSIESGDSGADTGPESSGCACVVAGTASSQHGDAAVVAMGLALLGFRRRRRSATSP